MIKPLKTEHQASTRIQHRLELLHERPRQACENTIVEIQQTVSCCMHQQKFGLDRQNFPKTTNLTKLKITENKIQ